MCCGARSIRRHSEQAILPPKLLLPVRQHGGEFLAFEPLLLPDGVVRIGARGLLQGARFPGRAGAVERREFAEEPRKRLQVRDDVVHRGHEHVLPFGQLQQQGADQWPRVQVEGAYGFRVRQALNHVLQLARRRAGQVDHRQVDLPFGGDDLNEPFAPSREGRTEDIMTSNQFPEAVHQGRTVQRTCDVKGVGNVVGGAVRGQLMQQPKLALHGRGREHGYAFFLRVVADRIGRMRAQTCLVLYAVRHTEFLSARLIRRAEAIAYPTVGGALGFNTVSEAAATKSTILVTESKLSRVI